MALDDRNVNANIAQLPRAAGGHNWEESVRECV